MKIILIIVFLSLTGCFQVECPDITFISTILKLANLCEESGVNPSKGADSQNKIPNATASPSIAEGKDNCADKKLEEMSDKCLDEYICPIASDPVPYPVVGVLYRGNIIGVVGLKNNEFTKVGVNVFTGYYNVFLLPDWISLKVKWNDYVTNHEMPRCWFSYVLEPKPLESDEVGLVVTEKNESINFAIDVPNRHNLEVFRAQYQFCDETGCKDQPFRRINKVFAITDLNRNGHQEYWHIIESEDAEQYFGDELDEITGHWKNIYQF